jgi:hypothetical protein
MSCISFARSFSLLAPLLWGAAVFFFLLAGRSMLRSRFSSKRWDMETIEWGRPQPSSLQRWRVKVRKLRFRLPRFAKREMPEIAAKTKPPAPATAPADPLKKPTPPMLALFGTPNGEPKDGFAWEETKGIE